MPEALTESFCERCGTRYEFAAPTQLNTIRKTRGLISGLRNYIMSQDALTDAVGDAMRSEEEALAAQQLDAFHDQFNFCISCRQYTCTNCWNDAAGRCRTCEPIAGTDDLLERFEATFTAQHPELAAAAAQAELEQAELNRRLGLEAWPTADLEVAPTNGNGRVPVTDWPAEEALPGVEPEPEPVVAAAEPEPEAEAVVAAAEEPETEPVVAAAEPQPEPEPIVAEAEPEPMVAEADIQHALVVVDEDMVAAAAPEQPPVAAEPPRLRVLTWEDDAAFELEAEPQPVVAEVAPEPEPEPVMAEVAPAAEPEPIVGEREPEPAVAEAESEPEPVTAPEPEPVAERPAPQPIRPISETIVQIPPQVIQPTEPAEERVAAEAEDPLVAARRAQLDMLGLGDPGDGPLAADRKVLPYRSSGASVHPAEIAARTAAGLPEPGAFWEASAREVAGAMSHVGVQSCGDCGLSLSASARFCRRCGTRQARSA